MRISVLAEVTGVPLATVKFYIREGMLPKGVATSATSAEYSEDHIKRIRLIQALSDVRALPLAQVKEILTLVDQPLPSMSESLSRAIGALPPYVDDAEEYPLARHALESLGYVYDTASAGVKQLNSAIQAVLDAGLYWNEPDIAFYGEMAMKLAAREVQPMMSLSREEMVPFAVLGTAMYEPIILALRRLAHQTLNIRFGAEQAAKAAAAARASAEGSADSK